MIATIKTRNIVHSSKVLFGAMIYGLSAERVQDDEVQVAYGVPEKVLEIVKNYGGRVVSVQDSIPVKRS